MLRIMALCGMTCLLACPYMMARAQYTSEEIDNLIKENKELRSELQKESKAAIDARNHAKQLFHELMQMHK